MHIYTYICICICIGMYYYYFYYYYYYYLAVLIGCHKICAPTGPTLGWKFLQHHPSTKRCPGQTTLGTNLVQRILVIRIGCTAVFLPEIPETSVESPDESQISRLFPRGLQMQLRVVFVRNRDSGQVVSTNILGKKTGSPRSSACGSAAPAWSPVCRMNKKQLGIIIIIIIIIIVMIIILIIIIIVGITTISYYYYYYYCCYYGVQIKPIRG